MNAKRPVDVLRDDIEAVVDKYTAFGLTNTAVEPLLRGKGIGFTLLLGRVTRTQLGDFLGALIGDMKQLAEQKGYRYNSITRTRPGSERPYGIILRVA